jgi:ligand-binding sensor protein
MEEKAHQEQKQIEEGAAKHKLALLSHPAVETGDLKLTDIIDVDVLQKLQDGFAESYDVASLIFDDKGKPITRPSNFSDFCKIIRATTKGLKKCEISDATLSRLVDGGSSAIAPCSNFKEIQDGAVPLFIGSRRVATWGIGQKAISDLSEEKVRSYATEIGANADQLAAAAKKLKIGSKEQFKKAVFFLETMAGNISLLGLQNMQLSREIAERRYVEEELKKKNEDLEGFNKIAVGRELKMIELKKEINTLSVELGREPKYKIVDES